MLNINGETIDQKELNIIATVLNPSVQNNETLQKNRMILEKERRKEGFIKILFYIANNEKREYDKYLCLNASIQIKNYIQTFYTILKPKDINFIRNYITQSLILSMNNNNEMKILKQFVLSLKYVFEYDFIKNEEFQKKFKEVLTQIFESKNPSNIYIGIIAFYQLSKIFFGEYSQKAKNKYNETFNEFHKYFKLFVENCIDFNNQIQNMILYKLIKIFYKTTYGTIPSIINKVENENFTFWINKVLQIAALNINGVTNKNMENINIISKQKKISLLILIRFYQKAGAKFSLYEDHKLNLNKFFLDKLSPLAIEILITIMSIENKNEFFMMDEEGICYAYQLMGQIIENKLKVKDDIIKAFKEDNTKKQNFIFDSLLMPKDFDYWFNSSKNYILDQVSYNNILSSQNKRIAVSQFINKLLELSSPTEEMLQNMLSFIFTFLNKYEPEIQNQRKFLGNKNMTEDEEFQYINQNMNNNSLVCFRIKESLIFILENLYEKMLIESNNAIPPIFCKFIFPELNSHFGFMRERVCSFIFKYKMKIFDFKGNEITEAEKNTLILNVIKKLCFLLENDKYIAVRIFSALSIPYFISLKVCRPLIAQNVKLLIEFYMKLMGQIDLDELINSIGMIIKELKNEVKEILEPICLFIVNYIQMNFKKEEKIIHLNEEKLNALDEKQMIPIENDENEQVLYSSNIFMVIDSALRMLLNLVNYFIEDEVSYMKIECHLIDILKYTLSKIGYSHIEEGLSIIIAILEKRKNISEQIWSLYPNILYSYFIEEKDDIENNYTEEIVTAICFYIIRDYKKITENQNNFKLIQEFFEKSTNQNNKGLTKIRYLYQIPILLLESCKENIDFFVIGILKYISNCSSEKDTKWNLGCGELFCSCVYYCKKRNVYSQYIIPFITSPEGKSFMNYFFTFLKNGIYQEYESKRYLLALAILAYENQDILENNLYHCFTSLFEVTNKISEAKISVLNMADNMNNTKENKIEDEGGDEIIYKEFYGNDNDNDNNEEEIFESLYGTSKEIENYSSFEGLYNDKSQGLLISGTGDQKDNIGIHELYQELLCVLKISPIAQINEIEEAKKCIDYLYNNCQKFKTFLTNDKGMQNLFEKMKKLMI
ncbi:MAG: hypothetical protein MJ252_07140 [archaeon]|nr:hypothetical protein [archaeon]